MILSRALRMIRGDDHIENTYRHIALYEALGAPVPIFGHLPMIVNAQGSLIRSETAMRLLEIFRRMDF